MHWQLEHVLGLQLEGTRLFLLGDLNADLGCPRDRQEGSWQGEWRGTGSCAPVDILWRGGPGMCVDDGRGRSAERIAQGRGTHTDQSLTMFLLGMRTGGRYGGSGG